MVLNDPRRRLAIAGLAGLVKGLHRLPAAGKGPARPQGQSVQGPLHQ